MNYCAGSSEINHATTSTSTNVEYHLDQQVAMGQECNLSASSSLIWIRNIPISSFSIALGLSSFTPVLQAWEYNGKIGLLGIIPEIFWFSGILVTILTLLVYMFKMYFFWNVVQYEYSVPYRSMIFFLPLLVVLSLAIGTPKSFQIMAVLKIIWGICFFLQIVGGVIVYVDWFSESPRNLQNAHPTYLMAIICWFLLSNLGFHIGLYDAARFSCATGLLLIPVVYGSVFGRLARFPLRNDPMIFLAIAPISQAALSLRIWNSNHEISALTVMLTHAVLFLFLFILRYTGIQQEYSCDAFGTCWVYTFPVNSVAKLTASIIYYPQWDTSMNIVFASFISIFASLLMTFAGCITILYMYRVTLLDNYRIVDPLLETKNRNQFVRTEDIDVVNP